MPRRFIYDLPSQPSHLASMTMQLQVLRSTDELARLESEWHQLCIPSPMQSYQWLTTWWEVYGQDQQELCVIEARYGGQLVGLAPMYLDTGNNLRWLGDGTVCSDHASLLAAEGYQEEFTDRVASLLMDSSTVDWQKLVFDSIDANAASTEVLLSALSTPSAIRSDRNEVGSCYVELPATWDEYLASISKNHRKRCRRWRKEYFLSERATVDVANRPEACLTAWQTLIRLHNARRNNLGDAGAFEDDQFTEFHRQALPKLAAAGLVQLRVLRVDDEAVAAEYLLCTDDTWFAYQSGMSEAGEAVSAGNLSIVSLMHDAITVGCRRIDLLRGVEPYKFSWGAVHCPSSTVTVRRPTIAGHLATLRDSAWTLARQAKRRISPRQQTT